MNIVLMYHDVVNQLHSRSGFQKIGSLQYTLSSIYFEEQIKQSASYDVTYSFDDGGCSFYKIIPSILDKYGKKGIFFISTNYIGTDCFLSAEQIRELDAQGHIIASHSHSHPSNISGLSKELCLKEWVNSKQILEDIVGHSVYAASIPGGAISDMVIDCMVEAGFTEIYTSEPTTVIRNYKGANIIGRYVITQSMSNQSFFKLIHNKQFRKKLLLKYKILKFAKVVFGANYNKIKQFALRLRQ